MNGGKENRFGETMNQLQRVRKKGTEDFMLSQQNPGYIRPRIIANQCWRSSVSIRNSYLNLVFHVYFSITTLGMDKTIQRGDLGKHGILFKIVPMHSEMKPSNKDFMSCWYKPVPKWLPRAGQSVIPTNLSEFKVRTDK